MPSPPGSDPTNNLSRRGFISAVGAGAAGAVTLGGTAEALADPVVRSGAPAAPTAAQPGLLATPADRFGRIFGDLPSFVQADDRNRAALIDMGKVGGILDARDNIAAGPVNLVVDLSLSTVNRNNPEHTAGLTFLGQFL